MIYYVWRDTKRIEHMPRQLIICTIVQWIVIHILSILLIRIKHLHGYNKCLLSQNKNVYAYNDNVGNNIVFCVMYIAKALHIHLLYMGLYKEGENVLCCKNLCNHEKENINPWKYRVMFSWTWFNKKHIFNIELKLSTITNFLHRYR